MSWRIAIRARIGALELDVDLHQTNSDAPMAIIGPNGCGKTTLLRVIAGAFRPDEGVIEVAGRCLFHADRRIDLPSERRQVGYVPQGYGLFPHLRAVDNVAFGLSNATRRLSVARRREVALQMLEQLGCQQLAARLPRQLSGGEQQRVALARALVIDPSLLLLDEPLSAMDATARRGLRTFLVGWLAAQRRPSIVVTHDLRDVVALGATICAMEGGRIVQRGRVAELRARPATDFIAEFVDADAPADDALR